MVNKMNLQSIMNSLNIKYEEAEHEAVYTAKEALYIKEQIKGVGAKNLFLKSKDRYYLVLIKDEEKADLKKLEGILNCGHLSFASELELKEILNLTRGAVSPLGLINDKENKASLVISDALVGEVLLMHPFVNTKTWAVKYDDLIKFVHYCNHEYLILR